MHVDGVSRVRCASGGDDDTTGFREGAREVEAGETSLTCMNARGAARVAGEPYTRIRLMAVPQPRHTTLPCHSTYCSGGGGGGGHSDGLTTVVAPSLSYGGPLFDSVRIIIARPYGYTPTHSILLQPTPQIRLPSTRPGSRRKSP